MAQEQLMYAVVTPVRNDAENLERLGACLASQTQSPSRWVIVENGSDDATRAVAEALAHEHEWVAVRESPVVEGGPRARPIVRAFELGIHDLHADVDLVVKIDADISFEVDHLERLVRAFEDDPRLGIASGSCWEQDAEGVWRQRFGTGPAVWGAARAYRMTCLAIVMPLEQRLGWDGIDVIEATVAGWTTATLLDLSFHHHRAEGSRERTPWSNWVAQGEATHYMHYHLPYLVLRSLFKARREPAAVGLVWGFLRAAARREPRCADPGVASYQREHQRLRSLGTRRREAGGRPVASA
jgi:glycosyltransferase involved in cell wall biosynthesis